MKLFDTEIPDVKIIEPQVFRDDRGYFFESFNSEKLSKLIGNINFVQDNESKSKFGVVRGLHYQLPPFAQAKLVRVIKGTVLDVAVDIRRNSPYFKKSVSVELSEENKRMFFLPHGFAHGFAVLSEYAIFSYKVDNYYSTDCERTINALDPGLNINWKISEKQILLSDKDKIAPSFENAELFS